MKTHINSICKNIHVKSYPNVFKAAGSWEEFSGQMYRSGRTLSEFNQEG